MQPSCLPQYHQDVLSEILPELFSKVDRARKARDWPENVVFPVWKAPKEMFAKLADEHPGDHLMSTLENIDKGVHTYLQSKGMSPQDRLILMHQDRVALFYGWRATKLEFAFDPDLAFELARTPMDGGIPVSLLSHLPANCVYLSLPDGILPGYVGLYACTQQWRKNGPVVLSLYLASQSRWPSHLCDVDLQSSQNVEDVIGQKGPASPELRVAYFSQEDPERDEKAMAMDLNDKEWKKSRGQAIGVCLNFLLYLCSQKPDLPDDYRAPKIQLKYMGAQSRVVVPGAVSHWPVGVRVGALFRANRTPSEGDSSTCNSGNSVRPHVRCAHWHTYWVGQKEQREAKLYWISPVLVGLKESGDLSAAIRPVSL